MRNTSPILVSLVALCLLGVSCRLTAREYVYEPPELLDDGWRVSTLEAEAMATDIITGLTNQVIDGKIEGIHSILIVRNGALVHEVYFDSCHREHLNTLYSITKSVTSGLVGIAIDRGYIEDVEQTVGQLLPEYRGVLQDRPLEDVTLAQLLTMTSGLDWDEWSYPYSDPRNSEYDQVRSRNWVRHVLDLPARDAPGSRWVYNTGGVHVLSAILEHRTGQQASQFADEVLFEPLGVTRSQWNAEPAGYTCTGGTRGGLRLRTRDIAKFGWAYMREGTWNGKQVIPREWVEESTSNQVTTPRRTGYGYLWWRYGITLRSRQIEMIQGLGYGGQLLCLVPDLDLMFVITSWGREEDAETLGPTLMILNAALQG